MNTISRIAAVAALAAAGFAAPALAQDRLTAVHAFPANWVYSKSFLQFVKKANDAGKGVFAIQVRGGTGSLRKMRAKTAVRSGLTLMTTSVLAVVVIESANRKAVNITAHIRPETRPGQPASRTAFQGDVLVNRR